ncbi:MAG: hypothetical protein HN509_07955 [Halobacteriovoraceae bacterium]|jgi:hypothetical protein|nr:hypothetical protein [Halobacteriovoraceae bacterium]MBT5094925.1 hypothetical protein [Halobacteriovoraceae bacterium]
MKNLLKSGLILIILAAGSQSYASDSQVRAEQVIGQLEIQKIQSQKPSRGPSAMKLQEKKSFKRNPGLELLSDFHGNFSFYSFF